MKKINKTNCVIIKKIGDTQFILKGNTINRIKARYNPCTIENLTDFILLNKESTNIVSKKKDMIITPKKHIMLIFADQPIV